MTSQSRRRQTLESIKARKPVFGMLHVPALPGTPANSMCVADIIEFVLAELEIYKSCGIEAVIIENMHDTPYLKGAVGPEIVATMTVVAHEVRKNFTGLFGVQVLAAANKQALAVALASNADFIRAEGYTFAHVADEGWIGSCAAELLRYRREIDAAGICVFADVKKKHSSHAITADVSLPETIHAAEFQRVDGVIVTGTATGQACSTEDLTQAKSVSNVPVLVGSGVTALNLRDYIDVADGFIVGSTLKASGHWDQPVDATRVREFMGEYQRLKML